MLWLARRTKAGAKQVVEWGVAVEVHWVPGHIAIEGNENADEVARSTAETSSI